MGNVEVFDNNRTANNTFIVWLCDNASCVSHTIQVWGVALFIVVTGLSTTSYLINESQLHTFCVYNSTLGASVV